MTTATTLMLAASDLRSCSRRCEPRVQRVDDDAERNGPEDRLHEAADQPEERERDREQQRDEKRSFGRCVSVIEAPVAGAQVPLAQVSLLRWRHQARRSAIVFS